MRDRKSPFPATICLISHGVALLLAIGCQNTTIDGSNSESGVKPSNIELLEFKLAVDTGSKNLSEQVVLAPAGITVFDLLRLAEAQTLISLDDFVEADQGTIVTSINGTKNDPDTGRFWIYYVNDKIAKVGCTTYRIVPGDTIRWSFQESPF